MALPKNLVDARKYLFRAARSINELYVAEPEPNLPLEECRNHVRYAVEWINEYTEDQEVLNDGSNNGSSCCAG